MVFRSNFCKFRIRFTTLINNIRVSKANGEIEIRWRCIEPNILKNQIGFSKCKYGISKFYRTPELELDTFKATCFPYIKLATTLFNYIKIFLAGFPAYRNKGVINFVRLPRRLHIVFLRYPSREDPEMPLEAKR